MASGSRTPVISSRRSAGSSERLRSARVLSAPHQLKHLDDELDFADAARTELDVVRQVALGHFVGDQRLHLAQRAEHPEIDVAAVDEGRQDLVEEFGAVAPAGDEPGLLVGIAFPVPAVPDQVILQRRQAHRQRPAGSERPQPRIDAECHAVRRRLVEQLDQQLHQAAEVLVRAGPGMALEYHALRIQDHEVHIRRKVEFAAAQLAHGQDHRFHRRSVGVHGLAETPQQLRPRVAVGGNDGAVGQQRQVGEVGVQIRPARQIPPGEARHLHVAHLPKHGHRLGLGEAVEVEPRRQALRGEPFAVRQAFQQRLRMAKQRGEGEIAADRYAGQRFRRPRMPREKIVGQRREAILDTPPPVGELRRQIGWSGEVHRHYPSACGRGPELYHQASRPWRRGLPPMEKAPHGAGLFRLVGWRPAMRRAATSCRPCRPCRAPPEEDRPSATQPPWPR